MKRLALLLIVAIACGKETTAPAPAQKPSGTPTTPSSSATYVRDPHSYARPADVRVEHLVLDLTVDFAKKQLAGTATLNIRNESQAKALILDTADLDIHSVKLLPGGAAAQFS